MRADFALFIWFIYANVFGGSNRQIFLFQRYRPPRKSPPSVERANSAQFSRVESTYTAMQGCRGRGGVCFQNGRAIAVTNREEKPLADSAPRIMAEPTTTTMTATSALGMRTEERVSDVGPSCSRNLASKLRCR